jgi:hypothetical protein
MDHVTEVSKRIDPELAAAHDQGQDHRIPTVELVVGATDTGSGRIRPSPDSS